MQIYKLEIYFDGDLTEDALFSNKENAAAYGQYKTQDYDSGEYTITEQPICDA